MNVYVLLNGVPHFVGCAKDGRFELDVTNLQPALLEQCKKEMTVTGEITLTYKPDARVVRLIEKSFREPIRPTDPVKPWHEANDWRNKRRKFGA